MSKYFHSVTKDLIDCVFSNNVILCNNHLSHVGILGLFPFWAENFVVLHKNVS